MSFFQVFVYLLAAVISVPLAKRLGLGSVLGYLLAGIVIGPFGLRLVGSAHGDVMHIAEFGVVMLPLPAACGPAAKPSSSRLCGNFSKPLLLTVVCWARR